MDSIFDGASKSSHTAAARSPTVLAAALRMKMSPGRACWNACSTRSTESASDMRNRVIVGSVTVGARPALICSTKRGITEPREYMTLPYRTQETTVRLRGLLRAYAWATFSINALLIPIALIGCTALSVLSTTTEPTPLRSAASMTLPLPRMLVRTASSGKNSQEGTCLSAAAWKT